MKIFPYIIVFTVCAANIAFAQHIEYAREIIDTLTSEAFRGRGYANNHDGKAANFIAAEFEKAGLQPIDGSYMQPFTLSANTFPGALSIRRKSTTYIAGVDFLPNPCSPPYAGKLKVVTEPVKSDHALIIEQNQEPVITSATKLIIRPTEDKLTWSPSGNVCDIPELIMRQAPAPGSKIEVNIESDYLKNEETQNVWGWKTGYGAPDTFLLFTAHYDHLGMLGEEAYIPGANDNASGVALICDLAQSFEDSYYSVLFLALSGEELGLLGSFYFVQNTPVPLSRIKWVFNLDLVGSGDDGITVVNGKEYPEVFNRMVSINEEKGYMTQVKARGEACNSDHCPFHMAGVPSFFIYTLGGITAYHDINDKGSTLPLTRYNELFQLILDTVTTFQP